MLHLILLEELFLTLERSWGSAGQSLYDRHLSLFLCGRGLFTGRVWQGAGLEQRDPVSPGALFSSPGHLQVNEAVFHSHF